MYQFTDRSKSVDREITKRFQVLRLHAIARSVKRIKYLIGM